MTNVARVGPIQASKAALRAQAEAGYRSTSPEFRKIVNITLSRSRRFERVRRGRYSVPGGEED